MVLKTSDNERNDASSSELQPMETFACVASSSLLEKHKAETPNTSESESDGESSDFDWDKDSFDGREYNSSDNEWDSDENEEFEKMGRSYHRLVVETKGFFVSSGQYPSYNGISPLRDMELEVKKGITSREFLEIMASLCVEKYNRRMGRNVKLVQILCANYNPGGRTTKYITFSAKESESPNARLVEYQAKAVWCGGLIYPIFCRPSPPPKTG